MIGEVSTKRSTLRVMTGLILIAALTFSPTILASPETQRFGTEYYDTMVRGPFQERVLVSWPGPSGLLELWQSGELNRGQKLSLLLGGAAFHDPLLLPVYREALESRNPRLRQAAAYGYRDLIGDEPPNVRAGVSIDVARSLVGELDAVVQTLQQSTLVEMWLASTLAAAGERPVNWNGIVFKKSPMACLKAVERLVGLEDLESVIRAYELSDDRGSRIGLMRLIEGLTLKKFIVKPQGSGKGWGADVYDDAFERLQHWLDFQCDPGVAPVLERAFADLGVRGLDPLRAEACDAWLQILMKARSPAWAMASERIYLCGGPAIRLSMARQGDEDSQNGRKRLKDWYGY